MKFFAVALASLILSAFFLSNAEAISKKSNSKNSKNVSVKVRSTKTVTNVKPHARTSRNDTKADNWSTIGNVNPYTGKKGTKRT